MLLDEPPPAQGELRFSLLGIPVRVHPLFWFISLVLGLGATGGEVTAVLIWIGVVFVSVLVHEMGHALVAKYYGWPPSITLYGMGGIASYRPTYYSTSSRVNISLAGPLAGFLLAALLIVLVRASGHDLLFEWSREGLAIDTDYARRIDEMLRYLLYVNIFWGLINLLPVLPLDGGHVARELLFAAGGSAGLRQAMGLSVAAGAAVAVYAYVFLGSTYLALMFAYLAYQNYAMLGGNVGSSGRWD